MRDISHLEQYYDNYDEEGRLERKYGRVEFLTTLRYIQRYLEPGMKILEIGAGTGRYSHALARMGYAVDAIELVQSNIDIFRRNTRPGEQITVRQGDALDLSAFGDGAYDIVLLLGPMYHLYATEEKNRALSEALRVAKPKGLLFTAYCIADASIICYGFRGGHMGELLEKNLIDTETFETRSTPAEVFELCRREEIDALMAGFPVDRLHYVATDLYTNYMRDEIDAMDEETFALYLKYHWTICERCDMTGITHHSLDIVRKR